MSGVTEKVATVEIYGQLYHIRGGGEPEYVVALAGFVDERMREISAATPTVDTLKVAILAALNIADRYFAARDQLQALEQSTADRGERMAAMLEQCLESRPP
jgi:cell division protein ZapA